MLYNQFGLLPHFSYCRIILLWTWVYKYLFDILLSILLGVYSQVELLDFTVILFFIFLKTVLLFSIVAAPSYVPTGNAQAFLFLYILTNTCYFLLVVFAFQDSHPNAYRVVFIVVLICIFLMVSDVKHLFMCHWPSVYFFGKMSIHIFCSFFNQIVCLFCCLFIWALQVLKHLLIKEIMLMPFISWLIWFS